MTPPDSPQPSNSLTPNFRLDPQGFRGTDTARRARQSRQRRQLRSFALALSLLIGVAALGWFGLQPRESGFNVVSARTLPLDLSAPATLDANGNLYVSSASGELWRVNSEGQSQNYDRVTASRAGAPPLASTEFVKVGGVYVSGLNGRLWAFDGGDKTLWQRDLGGSLATTPAHLKLGNIRILAVGDSDGKVIGLNADNGKTLWSAQLGGPIGDGLAVTKSGFIVPTLANGIWRGGLVALDGKTGKVKWRYPPARGMAAGIATPLFDADSNRVYWNNDEGSVASLDAASGRVIWQSEVAPAEAPASVMLRARPVLFGQSLIVGGNDGVLRSLDAGNGKARWIVDLEAPIVSLGAANVGGQPAVLATSERELVLVDASRGEIIQRDEGRAAWLLSGGRGAIVVGERGKWRRVSW